MLLKKIDEEEVSFEVALQTSLSMLLSFFWFKNILML